MTDKPTIFISYSHKDEKPWKELVEGHLRVAERQGVFSIWEDRQIDGGDEWRGEIDAALETADIAVLLISHNFLTSSFIMDHEVSALLERKQKELRDRLDDLATDDKTVQVLLDQAQSAIGEGRYDEADALLTQAKNADIRAAETALSEAHQLYLNAAATRALRGEASLTRLRYLDAADHFAEAAKLVPVSEPAITAGYLAQRGRALMRGNRTLDAIEAYEQATALDTDQTWSWIYLGRLRQQAGALNAAMKAFSGAQEAAKRHRNDYDEGVAPEGIGEIKLALGSLNGAEESYLARHKIIERLAASDPGNAGWQRDLSVSHNKIGDVRVGQGDLDGALTAYQASLAIIERLAEEDPGHAGWQRDLIVSRWRLADLAEQGYVSESALDHWQAALEIALELEKSGRLAPRDAYFVDMI